MFLTAILFLAVFAFFNLRSKPNDVSGSNVENVKYDNPVMIVQKGGKVIYFNRALGELFGLPKGSEIDLRIMAKKTNTPNQFFAMLTKAGSNYFEINGMNTEVVSIDTSNGMFVSFNKHPNLDEISNPEPAQSFTPEENRTSEDLSELAKFSYSLKNIHDSEELFSKIIKRIEVFLPFDIFGFILFDDQSQVLEAKKPFKGLPDQIVDIIKIKVSAQSRTEKILFSDDILLTENAIDDEVWANLGLSHFAQAATIQDSILIPLSPGDEPMGYLLAANHSNGLISFDQDEIHSLMIIANQSAPIIENFYLLLQAKKRTQRAEALRRISALASSNATVNEILTFSINELSQLLQADSGALYLVNKTTSKLTIDSESIFGNRFPLDHQTEILLSSPEFLESATFQKKQFLLGRFDEVLQIPLIYENILNQLALQSAIIVPLIIKDEAIGELFFGSKTVSFFDQGDVNIISSAANLLANVVEKENLSAIAFEAYQERVEQDKLIHELTRINEFNQRISSLALDDILQTFLDGAIKFLTSADAGWIGIVDENHSFIEPKFAHNFSYSIKTQIFDDKSIFSYVVYQNKKLLNNNFEFPGFYGLNDEQAANYLAATNYQIPNSCLLVPIHSHEKSIGVLVLETYGDENSFNEEDESIIQSLLQQVELAITKADLYKKSEIQSERLSILSHLSKSISSTLNWDTLKETLLINLQKLVDYDTATLWVKENQNLKIASTNGFNDFENREGIIVQIEDSTLFSKMFETKKPVIISDKRNNPLFPMNFEDNFFSWLGVPLISQTDVIGVIALEKKEESYFSTELVHLVESFATQAAIALTNADLYEESSNRLNELDEKTKKLDWLNQYSVEVNKTLDNENIALLTIESLTNLLSCDHASIFLLSGKDEVIEIYQNLITENQTNKITIFEVPIFQQLIQSKGTYYISDISLDFGSEFLKEYFSKRGTVSIQFLPLRHQEDVYGWIGMESKTSRRFFHDEVDLALTIANHTTLAIRNASLYLETKSLNENLEDRVAERSRDLLIENRNTEMLLKISTELAGSLDVDQILDRILCIINDSLKITGSFIYILEGKKVVHFSHDVPDHAISLQNLTIDEAIQQTIDTKNVVLKNSSSHIIGDLTCKSWLLTPLIFGEMVLGVLALYQQTSGYFSKRDVELSEAVAGQISLALNNAEIFKLVRDQSEYLGSMLREQEIETSRSKAILEAVADGVLVTGTQSEIILINRSASHIFGIDGNVENVSLERLNASVGEKITSWITTINDWTTNFKSINSDAGYTDQIELPGNQFVYVHLSPVIWKNEFLGTVSILRDVSKEVQIDQLKSDFISNISHELRTPLTSIKGYVEILLMEASGKVNEQQKSFLNTIQNNTARLTNLVDEILDVNKISSKNIVIENTTFNVIELIRKVVSEKQSKTSEKQKRLVFKIHENGFIPQLVADPVRVEQIINNILNNAIDYSQDNDEIVIVVSSENQIVKIEIKDNGIGIPIEEQEFVFDRFYRGTNAIQINTAGAGLGLSIAKTLVEMQGGKIEMESPGIPGEGVIISIFLPINFNEVAS